MVNFLDIKQQAININEDGHYILRLADLLDTLPSDLQSEYASKLLVLISEYYKNIEELNKLIDSYKQNNVVDIKVEKLSKELKKFHNPNSL